jgi:transcription termination factor Rho
LLIKPDQLQKIWVLRKLLYGMDEIEAMGSSSTMRSTKNNAEFFEMMRRGGLIPVCTEKR